MITAMSTGLGEDDEEIMIKFESLLLIIPFLYILYHNMYLMYVCIKFV